MGFITKGRLTGFAVILAAIAITLFLIGGPGHRFGLWSYEMGFTLLRYAAYVGIGAAIIGALPLLHIIWWEKRMTALIAVAAGLFVMMNLQGYINKARQLPPIHDISTDLDSPPQFEAIQARDEAERGFSDTQHRVLQEVYYRDIQPLLSPLNTDQTLDVFETILSDMGVEIIAVDRQRGRIEGVATTAWFGFKDDVVIRVSKAETGSIVDVRSVSRVGRSDIGKNAERIRDIFSRANKALK